MSTTTQERVMIDAAQVIDHLDEIADFGRKRFNSLPWWQIRSRWYAYGAWKTAETYRDALLGVMAAQFGIGTWGRK